MTKEEEDRLYERITAVITDGRIGCKELLAAAKAEGTSGEDARKTADRRNIKIAECQLGFFGWEGREVPAAEVTDTLKDCIQNASVDKTVTCRALWDCAASCGASRRDAGAAVDLLGLKARGCQLGIF